jgi:hypothetical protein
MKIKWHVNLVVLAAFISLASISTAEEELKLEGLIDIDYPEAGEAKVEVNLAGPLFSLAAKAVGDEDPETAGFLASLKAVRVRIYEQAALGGKSFDEVLEFYKKQMQKPKWEVLARVKDKESTVGVYSLTKEKKDIISGLVVIVGNPKEWVIVNLAGEIDVTKLPEINEAASKVLGLPKIDLGEMKSSPEQKKEQKGAEVKSDE